MTVSLLLRLAPDQLARGRLVGRLRVVATGEEHLFRDAQELIAIAAEVAREPPARDAPERATPPAVDQP